MHRQMPGLLFASAFGLVPRLAAWWEIRISGLSGKRHTTPLTACIYQAD
jgi:hypothetical protein